MTLWTIQSEATRTELQKTGVLRATRGHAWEPFFFGLKRCSPIQLASRRRRTVTFHYYPETDSLYINLSSKKSAQSDEVSEKIVLDFDIDGNLVGIDIDHASSKVDLTQLTIDSLPLSGLSMTKAG